MKQKHTLWVNLAFAAVILVLAGLLLVLRKGPSDAPLAAELIYGDNNTVMQIPLDGPARYDVDTGYLTVHIEVTEGAAGLWTPLVRTMCVKVLAGSRWRIRPPAVCRPGRC